MATNSANEVAAIDRILTRLALTPEDQLQQILDRLIAPMIDQLKTTDEAVRKKVLEVLTHVNKRIKDRKQIKLPLQKLVDQFTSSTAAMVRNFALIYIQTAFERASSEEKFSVLPQLLAGVSARASSQQEILLRCAIEALSHIGGPSAPFLEGPDFKKKFEFLDKPSDLQVFLDFALDFLKLPMPSTSASSVGMSMMAGQAAVASLNVGRGAQAEPPTRRVARMRTDDDDSDEERLLPQRPSQLTGPVPYGGRCQLSRSQITRLIAKWTPTEAELAKRKEGILNFLTATEVEPDLCYLHYLQASCDPDRTVSALGDFQLKKRIGLDGPKPAVDLESNKVVNQLFALFDVAASLPMQVPVALRQKILNVLNKSVAAANKLDLSFQIIEKTLDHYSPLKQAGMQYTVWVLRHCEQSKLVQKAPAFLQLIRSIIDSGQRMAQNTKVMTLRGFAYQALSQLGERVPSLLQNQLDIPEYLFTTLATEAPGVRASLQQSLSTLSAAYADVQGSGRDDIRQLLLSSLDSPSEGVRYCAVQWAVRIFPPSDFSSRYICIVASSDHKTEIREAALKGLNVTEGSDKMKKLPSIGEIAAFLQMVHPALGGPANPSEAIVLKPKAFLELLKFIDICKKQSLKDLAGSKMNGSDSDIEMDGGQFISDSSSIEKMHRGLLEHALVKEGTSELYAQAFKSLLKSSNADRQSFASDYADKLDWLQTFLSSVNAEVRLYASKLVGIVSTALSTEKTAKLLEQLTSQFAPTTGGGTPTPKFEVQAGSMTAAALVIAADSLLRQGKEVLSPKSWTSFETAIAGCMRGKNSEISMIAAASLGYTGRAKAMALDLCSPPADSGGKTSLLDILKELCESKELKICLRSITALGYWAGAQTADQKTRSECTKLLLSLHSRKEDQVQFAVGEALCFAWGGLKLSVEDVLFSDFTLLSTEMKKRHWEVATTKSGEADHPMNGTATSSLEPADAALLEQQSMILSAICNDYICHSRVQTRSAASIWLVSILNYTVPGATLMSRLGEIQEAFCSLLSDTDELVQEMASRGVSTVYRLSSEEQQKDLMTKLVTSLSGGSRKRRAVEVTGETRVFEDGQMGEAPGGGKLSTYKELCSLATDMGQPDLLYKFMDLANHANSLNSSRGAAFGIASIARLAGEQMKPHVAALVPKLYRYKYDPNPKIRDGMSNIWKVLLSDPRQAVEDHFNAIMAELLKEMGGKLWRNREAACGGLADLIQGRSWKDMEKHFEKIWVMAFRALDDVKESVRAAALILARSMQSLTLRLADKSLTSPAQSSAAIAVSLPLLIQNGTSSNVGSIQTLALTTIAKLVTSAGREQIRPHIPELVPSMLESLSSMENPEINYVEQHISSLGISSERLENLRVSASKSSPMGDTLDYCARYSDADTVTLLVPKLVSLVRRGLGLNTRVGTASFITNLTMRLASDMKPFTSNLIKNLFAAAQNENSGAVRKAYASSIAELAKFAPETRMHTLATELVDLYASRDDRGRFLAGQIAKEIAKTAAEAFSAQASTILPTAYLARSDGEKTVAGQWEEVWQEGMASEGAGLRLYMKEIIALAIAGLQSQQWERKKCAAETIIRICQSKSEALQTHGKALQDELLEKLQGRIWEGKECLLQALAALCTALPSEMETTKVVEALLDSMKLKKTTYRTTALVALAEALSGLKQDLYSDVSSILQQELKNAVSRQTQGKGPSEESEDVPKTFPVTACLDALSSAWAHVTLETASRCLETHAACLASALDTALPWTSRHRALTACKDMLLHLDTLSGDLASKDGPFSPKCLEIILSGVLSAMKEPKISQVRAEALSVLNAAALVSEDGKLLPSETLAQIWTTLLEFVSIERNGSVASQASALKDKLTEAAKDHSLA